MSSRIPKLLFFIVLISCAGFIACSKGAGSAQNGATPGGPAAPERNIALTTLDGAKTSLAEQQGKIVLVNFWATWCEPCQAEIPWLIDFNNKYSSKGLVILGVAMDDEGKKVVEPYVHNHPFTVNGKTEMMNYPIVLGNDNIFQKFGGGIGLPTTVLYSRDGRKVMTTIGSLLVNQSQDKLVKAVEAQL
jgi:thiol-disulfide isomerase/thioredoxin